MKTKFTKKKISLVTPIELPKWQNLSLRDRIKLRPISESLALIDGNAFFGNFHEINNAPWQDQYANDAYVLYEHHGGDKGRAGQLACVKPFVTMTDEEIEIENLLQYEAMLKDTIEHHKQANAAIGSKIESYKNDLNKKDLA
jgi:hypothetical protein